MKLLIATFCLAGTIVLLLSTAGCENSRTSDRHRTTDGSVAKPEATDDGSLAKPASIDEGSGTSADGSTVKPQTTAAGSAPKEGSATQGSETKPADGSAAK